MNLTRLLQINQQNHSSLLIVQLNKDPYMFLFLFFFLQNLHGQFLQLANESMPTIDGQGTIYNDAICFQLGLQPQAPFQNIQQNSETGEIIISSSANTQCVNFPSIVFNKKPRIVGYIMSEQITLSLNHGNSQNYEELIIGPGKFDFFIEMAFKKYADSKTMFVKIMISGNSVFEKSSWQPWEDFLFLSSAPQFAQPTFNSKSFAKTFNLSSLLRCLILNNKIFNNDILTKISLKGIFYQGTYKTSINYTILDDYVYQYAEKNIPDKGSFTDFYFQPTVPSSGDFQYLRYSKTNSQVSMFFVLNQSSTNKLRPCSGGRLGYFNGEYHKGDVSGVVDYDYFPLDPGLQTNFQIFSSEKGDYDPDTNLYQFSRCLKIFLRRDYNPQDNNFKDVVDETLISQQIYICYENIPVLQQGIFVQQIIYGGLTTTPILFTLYEKINTTVNEPHIYHFLGNLSQGDQGPSLFNLYFFVNRLYKAGKFKSNQRISEISKCLRFYSGVGTHTFFAMVYPNKNEISFKTTCPMPGCIKCDTVICFACSTTENWTLVKNVCVNNQSQASISKLRKEDESNNLLKSLSCLLSQHNSTENSCLTAPLPIQGRIALTLTSTPHIGLVFKVSQLLCFVDDFMLYIYANMTYGDEFHQFLYFMWNISIERWIPYSLSSFYHDIQDRYGQKTKMQNIISLPKLWTDLDEDTGFITNTRDFWISSIPFTIITFLLFHLFFRLLGKCQFKEYLITFKWFTILVVNIFLQNLQLLAFRAFQQILYIQPPYSQSLLSIYFGHQIVCYITFFCVVISACAGQFLVQVFIGKNVEHVIDFVFYSQSTIWFMILLQVIKLINGFMHASFQLDNTTKFSFLLGTQMVIFFAIIYFKQKFRQKTMFVLMVYEYLLKIFIHLCLIVRAILSFNQYELERCEKQILGNIQITIIWIIFGIGICELVTVFIKQAQLEELPLNVLNKLNPASSFKNRKNRNLIKKTKVQIAQARKIQVIVSIEQKLRYNINKKIKEIVIKNTNNLSKQHNNILSNTSEHIRNLKDAQFEDIKQSSK